MSRPPLVKRAARPKASKAKPLPFAPWPREWCGGPAAPHGEPRLRVTLDVATKSEANERGFFAAKNRKQKQDRALDAALEEALVAQPLPATGPWCVRFTRLGRARLDDDNLGGAFKRLRDRLAKVIGIDDGSPCIAFAYAQERAAEGAVRVEVWGPEARQIPLFTEARA